MTRAITSLFPLWQTPFLIKGENLLDLCYIREGCFRMTVCPPCCFVYLLLYSLPDQRVWYVPCHSSEPISHSLFMDDLKLYSSTEEGLEQGLLAVMAFSRATGMRVNPSKCARVYSFGGRLIQPSATDRFPEIRILQGRESYKYLGVEQQFGVTEEVVKFRLREEFNRRLEWIWRSEFSGCQKVEATNLWAISLYNYFLPLMRWQNQELVALDRKEGQGSLL